MGELGALIEEVMTSYEVEINGKLIFMISSLNR